MTVDELSKRKDRKMKTNDELRKTTKALRKALRSLERAMEVSVVSVPEVVRVNDAYSIGKYPVTNEEYLAFVIATGYKCPTHWKDGTVPEGKERHPVAFVSYDDAVAYCEWLSSATGRKFRLPTGDEWTKAATGGSGREYPWGDEKPNETRCNFNMNVGDTTPVGQYPDGASPYGAQDMSGNVWEWTSEVKNEI